MGVQFPLADQVARLLNLPLQVANAVIPGFVWWAIYRLIRFAVWEPWDQRERTKILHQAARAARATFEERE
jgi:hypothetical protein